MPIFYQGELVSGFRGPAGPDGTPVGTVISFMGLTAPKDYLACDGAEYSIERYSELADFFRVQFGAVNYFGGNGTTTFAVPDLRNLFLRGYHGTAGEQLSGNVGIKQDATVFPDCGAGLTSYYQHGVTYVGNPNPTSLVGNYRKNPDTIKGLGTTISSTMIADTSGIPDNKYVAESYTARPVNMAVLYCIKAVKSLPYGESCSTMETVIGTWIDGKPLYRKVVEAVVPNHEVVGAVEAIIDLSGLNIESYAKASAFVRTPTEFEAIPFFYNTNHYMTIRYGTSSLGISYSNSWYAGDKITIILEYTKTTD